MKYKLGFWGVGLCLMVFVGCGKATASKQSATDGFVEFAQQEIAWLQKTQPGLRKTVSKGEEVSTETMDSVDWDNELEWVTAWSLIESAKKTHYDENCALQCPGYDGRIARIDGELSQKQSSIDAMDHQTAQLVYGSGCADIVSAQTRVWDIGE